MGKRKLGIGIIEINRKFDSFGEASRYSKRLREYIHYISKKKEYQASVITVVSNTKKEVSDLRYINSGKRGRPKKDLVIYERTANEWYKGNYHTDWHIHILIVSKPGYALRNHIKDYVDRNWINIPKIYEKEDFDINDLKKRVYKKECNIKVADYFIDQSSEIRFVNCNYGGEKDFDYTLKEYYREYMKVKSGKERLYKKYRLNTISIDDYESKLVQLDNRFKIIEDYFYSITKEQEEKEQKEYMNKVRLSKIRGKDNKVQDISRRQRYEETTY